MPLHLIAETWLSRGTQELRAIWLPGDGNHSQQRANSLILTPDENHSHWTKINDLQRSGKKPLKSTTYNSLISLDIIYFWSNFNQFALIFTYFRLSNSLIYIGFFSKNALTPWFHYGCINLGSAYIGNHWNRPETHRPSKIGDWHSQANEAHYKIEVHAAYGRSPNLHWTELSLITSGVFELWYYQSYRLWMLVDTRKQSLTRCIVECTTA